MWPAACWARVRRCTASRKRSTPSATAPLPLPPPHPLLPKAPGAEAEVLVAALGGHFRTRGQHGRHTIDHAEGNSFRERKNNDFDAEINITLGGQGSWTGITQRGNFTQRGDL